MLTSIARLLAVIALALSFHLVSGCSSGGSTGPNGEDPNNPSELTFDYCEVVEVDNQMHVRWSANRPTRGDFRFGQSALVQISAIGSFADEQDLLLIGLEFDADYIYELTITDISGNHASREGDFTTPLKATPEPAITNLEFTNITESQAVVSWVTDELATTVLYYGAAALADSIVQTGYNYEHEVTLTDLDAQTEYAVRAEAVDLDGLRGVGNEMSFSTSALLILSFGDVGIALGETTEVAIHINGAQDLAALQYRLQFADTLGANSGNGAVQILDLRAGPFTTSERAPLFFQDIRNAQRFVTNEMAWVIEYNGNERIGTVADGNGVVAILTLRATKSGSLPSSFDEDDSFGLDMFATQRACSLRAGLITVLP